MRSKYIIVMADDIKEQDVVKKSNDPVTVASLSIPQIIVALHQKALAEANASSQHLRIVNSAIDDKDNKSKIQSAGEHIISVLPVDKGAKVQKKVAIELLKKYVQWFIGPDLANKVDNSTVMSLKQSPLKENRRFMSFQQFLLEEADAKEGDDKTKEQNDPGDTSGKTEQTSQSDKKNDAKDDGKGSGDEQDENVTSDVGYYLPYDLKVEGLKQTALKDAVKKFASTFFDDVTFKSSGLFGGGDQFSIKDVKDKWRDAFGPIDPDDLVDKVRKQIEDISHPNTDPPTVKIRDRKTLISDLGKAINGKEKQMIDQAKYSLWISLREYDPKKPLFNRRVVADIVTSSMKGLWKKFKNKITKDDVIFLEDYVDTHEDTKALRDLQELIPDVPEILAFIDKASTAADAFNKIKNKIDAVIKHKQKNNSSIAQACIKVWEQFSDTHKSPEEQSRMTSLTHDKKKDFFQKFIAAYKKAYDKYYDKSLRESLDMLHKMTYVVNVKKLVLESLFNEADGNEDSKEAKEEKKISFNKIKQYAQQYVTPKPDKIFVDYKATLIKMCDILDTKDVDFDKAFGEFKHGILVDYTGQIDEQKSLSESIKNDIFGILNLNQIQEDEDKKNDASSNDSKKTNDKEAVDKNKLKNALLKALEKNGIAPDDCGELFEIMPVVINESKLSDYIEKKNLSKEDALKPETIEDLKKNVFQKKGTEFIQDKINKYFDKKTSGTNASDDAKYGDVDDNDASASEMNTTDPQKIFGQQDSKDIISQIESSFTGNLKAAKLTKNTLANTVTGLFGKIDYIKQALDKVGIFNEKISSISSNKEYEYAFAIPVQLGYKDKNGDYIKIPSTSGKMKNGVGTQGADKLTDKIALQAMQSALKNEKITEDVEDFFTYEKESPNWYYFRTKHPSKCKVYVGFVKNIDDPDKKPQPGDKDDDKDDKKMRNAYILPFGKDDLQPGPDDKFTDDDDEGHGRTDLYIVPIKNMNYKDKEYDTYA